jgi:hypothetical protein
MLETLPFERPCSLAYTLCISAAASATERLYESLLCNTVHYITISVSLGSHALLVVVLYKLVCRAL